MTRRAYGFYDWSKEAVLLPKPPKPHPKTTGTDAGQGDLLAPVVPAARNTDPSTSNAAIHDLLPRAGSQQHRLLLVYADHPMGLTNEEAGDLAGLSALRRCCYWRRCGNLLEAGLIEDTLQEREASTGSMQRVCSISKRGREALAKITK